MDEENGTEQNNEERSDVRLYKFSIKGINMSLNLTYMTSILGILNAAETVVSLLGLISLAAGFDPYCDHSFGARYGFYDFIGSTVLVTRMIAYILFVFSIEEKWCLRFIPWLISRFVALTVYSVFFLIASSLVASRICGQGGNTAAVIFGFILTLILAADSVFSLLKLRSDHPPSDNSFLNFLGVEKQPPGSNTDSSNNTEAPEDHKY